MGQGKVAALLGLLVVAWLGRADASGLRPNTTPGALLETGASTHHGIAEAMKAYLSASESESESESEDGLVDCPDHMKWCTEEGFVCRLADDAEEDLEEVKEKDAEEEKDEEETGENE